MAIEVSEDEVTTETLLAGQDIPVGEVSVTHHTGGSVTVAYEMFADFCLTETHWEANYDQNNLTTGGGNPQIGTFANGDDTLDCVSEYTETGDILGTPDGDYIVAAHAVVEGAGGGENPHVVFGTYDAPGDGSEEGDIYGINPTTGDVTLVVDVANDGTGDHFDPNGLAIDRSTEQLFFVSELDLFVAPADGSAAPSLVTSDLDVSTGGEGTIRNATVADGFYYYVPNGTDELWRVGTDGSGNALYCDMNGPGDGELYFGDIAASLDDSTIYGVARVDDPTTGDVRFFTVDIDGDNDCSTTSSASFVDPGYSVQLQVAFGDDGTLYGQEAVSEPSSDLPGQWYTLDPATGQITATLAQSERSFTDIAGGLPSEPTEFDETAWAEGDRFTERGSWAMFMGPFEQLDD